MSELDRAEFELSEREEVNDTDREHLQSVLGDDAVEYLDSIGAKLKIYDMHVDKKPPARQFIERLRGEKRISYVVDIANRELVLDIREGKDGKQVEPLMYFTESLLNEALRYRTRGSRISARMKKSHSVNENIFTQVSDSLTHKPMGDSNVFMVQMATFIKKIDGESKVHLHPSDERREKIYERTFKNCSNVYVHKYSDG